MIRIVANGWFAVVLAWLLVVAAWPNKASGQVSQAENQESQVADDPQREVAPEYASPLDTLRTFLQSMQRLDADPAVEDSWQLAFGALEMSASLGDVERKDFAGKLFGVLEALEFELDEDFLTALAPGGDDVQQDLPTDLSDDSHVSRERARRGESHAWVEGDRRGRYEVSRQRRAFARGDRIDVAVIESRPETQPLNEIHGDEQILG